MLQISIAINRIFSENIYFCIIGIFMLACSRNDNQEAIIPMEKIQKVLWDLVQADQFSTQFLKRFDQDKCESRNDEII